MQSALAAAGEHRGCSQFTLCISHLNQTCYGTTRFLLMMMIYIMTQFMYDLAVKRRGSSVLHTRRQLNGTRRAYYRHGKSKL